MSLTTAFISELVWAANQVEHLTAFEKGRLLDRAAATIREMQEQASLTVEQDHVIDLQTTAAGFEGHTGDHVRMALLDAANIIRTLRIHLETTARPN